MSMKERNARFTIKMLNKVFIEGDEEFEKKLKKFNLIHDMTEHRKEVLGWLKDVKQEYDDFKKQYKGDEDDFEKKQDFYEEYTRYYKQLADMLYSIVFKLENGKEIEDLDEEFKELNAIQQAHVKK